MTTRVAVICLLLSLLVFCFGCPPDDDGPDPVEVGVYFHGDPPSEYDCPTQSRFVVALRPENSLDLVGDYLQMYFQLKRDGTAFYISNDIEFPLGTDRVYYLEFGGAIEGQSYRDEYDIVATVRVNGQANRAVTSEARKIGVTEKTSFSKTMHIEYDCQEDWELPSSSFAKLTAAFHAADTDTDFFRDEVALPEECIWWDSLPRYQVVHFSNTSPYNMHLLSVKGLWDNSAKQEITLGASIPGPLGFSYVFMGDIYDWHYGNELNVAALITVHEFGHQRAGLTHASVVEYDPQHPPHPELHDSPFCAMNQDICYTGNNDNDPNNDPAGLKRWFDRNPHLCDMCVNAIKNVSW